MEEVLWGDELTFIRENLVFNTGHIVWDKKALDNEEGVTTTISTFKNQAVLFSWLLEIHEI